MGSGAFCIQAVVMGDDGRMRDRMTDRTSGRMPENMSDRMWMNVECMSDRMPKYAR